jgi:molybdate transport system substrate-binding protein
MVAAAASLEASYREIIPLFEKTRPGVRVEVTYDSSGKLQVQIEQGLDADVFMSASQKQMNALLGEGLVLKDSVRPVLENRIVLIKTAGTETPVTDFATITRAETIALGDPASVPAGQYAEEALSSLGVFDRIMGKTSFAANVTQVLSAVGEGSADVGIVYATDALRPDYTSKVEVIAEAPAGSLKTKVVYPAAVTAAAKRPDAARAFLDFLLSPPALAVFEKYGFSPAGQPAP